MDDIVEHLGLRSTLEDAGLYVEGEGFELLYSRVAADGARRDLKDELERQVLEYFSDVRLPSTPTLYDYLLLSLRKKDIVASFNWDPLLIQAYRRCRLLAPVPLCVFLHGNVALGYCSRHDSITFNLRGRPCEKCGKPVTACPLLYPIAQKDYAEDLATAASWRTLRQHLQGAFVMTIFGYSAPETDVEAVSLLREAWGPSSQRKIEEIEIIDTASEDVLRDRWTEFLYSHHYRVETDFFDSILARLPRRSVEMMFQQIVDAGIVDEFPLPRDANWEGLRAWIRPFREQEISTGA